MNVFSERENAVSRVIEASVFHIAGKSVEYSKATLIVLNFLLDKISSNSA